MHTENLDLALFTLAIIGLLLSGFTAWLVREAGINAAKRNANYQPDTISAKSDTSDIKLVKGLSIFFLVFAVASAIAGFIVH